MKETWIGNARKAAAFDQLLQEWARSKISLVDEQIDLEIESQSYRLGKKIHIHVDMRPQTFFFKIPQNVKDVEPL